MSYHNPTTARDLRATIAWEAKRAAREGRRGSVTADMSAEAIARALKGRYQSVPWATPLSMADAKDLADGDWITVCWGRSGIPVDVYSSVECDRVANECYDDSDDDDGDTSVSL